MNTIKKYLSLVKFAHTVFALPFALIGFFLASEMDGYEFHWQLFALVFLCMVFARNAAMSFNRYADRSIDSLNPRTILREIPAGIIKPNSALFFCLVNALLFIVTTCFLNPLCFYLSPIALLVILGYSFTKRFTFLSHLVLGLGLSLAPIGAYIAVSGHFAVLPVLFSFLVLLWVAGFDIIYALQDEEFDREQGLNSLPARLGKKNALQLSVLLHILCLLFPITAGIFWDFGWLYWTGLVIFTIMLILQHTLVKSNNLKHVSTAFFTTNGFASLAFAFFVIMDLFV